MAKIILDAGEATDLKTPLYHKREGTVYRLLPETGADQVKTADGGNVENRLASLRTDLNSAADMAQSGLETANSALAKANANTSALAGKAGTAIATQSENGLMSAGDKEKLDGIQPGAQVNPDLSGFVTKGDTYNDMTSRLRFSWGNNFANYYRHNAFVLADTPYVYANRLYIAVLQDAANQQIGAINYLASGNSTGSSLNMSVTDKSGATHTAGITGGDGAGWFFCPTPPAASNGTQAVTAAFLNSRLGSGASVATLAMLDETLETYTETLESKKLRAVAELNAAVQQAIYAGFPYEIDGETYFIGYSLFDQQNLASRALIAAQDPDSLIELSCMNETGQKVWLTVPGETVLAIHKYGLLDHTDVILKAADAKKALIMAAENEEQILAIMAE